MGSVYNYVEIIDYIKTFSFLICISAFFLTIGILALSIIVFAISLAFFCFFELFVYDMLDELYNVYEPKESKW